MPSRRSSSRRAIGKGPNRLVLRRPEPQDPAFRHCPDRPRLAVHDVPGDLEQVVEALRPVGVRILLHERQDVGAFHHPIRQVSVRIQDDHHGHVGPDNLACPAQDVAFAVQAILRHHRAVQHQEHGVHTLAAPQIIEQCVAHLLVVTLRHGRAGLGDGAQTDFHLCAELGGARRKPLYVDCQDTIGA